MDTVLKDVEDLTCPICLEVIVGCQTANPCGHSACGACSYGSIKEKAGKKTCFTCSAELDSNMPFTPNLIIDSLITKHVTALGSNGDALWQDNGVKKSDWEERKCLWVKEYQGIRAELEQRRIDQASRDAAEEDTNAEGDEESDDSYDSTFSDPEEEARSRIARDIAWARLADRLDAEDRAISAARSQRVGPR